jgi:hypothetical protein
MKKILFNFLEEDHQHCRLPKVTLRQIKNWPYTETHGDAVAKPNQNENICSDYERTNMME